MYNGPNIGIYAKANEDFIFLPHGFAEAKSKKLSEYLQTDVIVTSVANTSLIGILTVINNCLLYTSPSPRDRQKSRMPSSA